MDGMSWDPSLVHDEHNVLVGPLAVRVTTDHERNPLELLPRYWSDYVRASRPKDCPAALQEAALVKPAKQGGCCLQ